MTVSPFLYKKKTSLGVCWCLFDRVTTSGRGSNDPAAESATYVFKDFVLFSVQHCFAV